MIISVLDYLEKTVKRYPEKVAFHGMGKTFTFKELQREAKTVGSTIAGIIPPKQPVLVYMEKSVNSISTFLGCIYAGCFYVPIDKDMPAERVRMIIELLSPKVMICDKKTEMSARELADDVSVILYEDGVKNKIDENVLAINKMCIKSTDLMYLLFTSGSTGVPKGVTISHGAVIDFIEWICGRYGFDESTSFCNQSPFYFDVSLADIYVPMKTGATTYIPPKSFYTFPQKVLSFINEHQINTLIWVASAICNVVNCRAFDVTIPETVRFVVFTAEVMPCKHLNEWMKRLPNTTFVNMYGPTEATCFCTYYHVTKKFSDNDKIPLGKSCENSEIILITDDNRQAGVGEIGELCILGQCLSQGYYNDRERTKEVFVQNPLNPYWTEIMYRTGDLAYTNEDGDIIFAGRKDFQIKRLGYRIELGEIETAILSLKEIRNACCLFNKSTSEIIAVYTGEITERELSACLHQVLPQYMLPNRYICLETMPLNLNGKIDRIKLYKEYVGE